MIITDKLIKAKTILVRFYNYSDTEKGWGDSGTFGYYKIRTENFDVEEATRRDGSKYYRYFLKQDVAMKIFGNYWWIGKGYENTTESNRKKELKDLEDSLKRVKEVQSI